ncbi:hypothetical protein CSUI_001955 [Cystoisospora suis]|uniref:Uncharacterized protein n=1 Tax=Cystoisospora suis TaxID=483139 RepID=A0A2C6LAP0_9APIC|nr:hypothetical protein CSUI_001955 [Cystoisospora suis]
MHVCRYDLGRRHYCGVRSFRVRPSLAKSFRPVVPAVFGVTVGTGRHKSLLGAVRGFFWTPAVRATRIPRKSRMLPSCPSFLSRLCEAGCVLPFNLLLLERTLDMLVVSWMAEFGHSMSFADYRFLSLTLKRTAWAATYSCLVLGAGFRGLSRC